MKNLVENKTDFIVLFFICESAVQCTDQKTIERCLTSSPDSAIDF